jgi:hypothetical protein
MKRGLHSLEGRIKRKRIKESKKMIKKRGRGKREDGEEISSKRRNDMHM